jgi:hypothetical protein
MYLNKEMVRNIFEASPRTENPFLESSSARREAIMSGVVDLLNDEELIDFFKRKER